jgi:hypothetical protein
VFSAVGQCFLKNFLSQKNPFVLKSSNGKRILYSLGYRHKPFKTAFFICVNPGCKVLAVFLDEVEIIFTQRNNVSATT